jgi:hypothetical protein
LGATETTRVRATNNVLLDSHQSMRCKRRTQRMRCEIAFKEITTLK